MKLFQKEKTRSQGESNKSSACEGRIKLLLLSLNEKEVWERGCFLEDLDALLYSIGTFYSLWNLKDLVNDEWSDSIAIKKDLDYDFILKKYLTLISFSP